MSLMPSVKGVRKKPGETRLPKERAYAICDRIAGGMTVGKACAAEGLNKSRLLDFVSPRSDRFDQGIHDQYRFALAERAEARISALVEQADRVMTAAKNGAGASYVTAFMTKARILQWAAEREAPKVYGAKVDLNHGGAVRIVADKADLGLL